MSFRSGFLQDELEPWEEPLELFEHRVALTHTTATSRGRDSGSSVPLDRLPGVPPSQRVGHRWRDYRTPSGRRPVKQFIDSLSDQDAAEVAAAMADVKVEGLRVARHLRGDIYEVRADGPGASVRILFAQEGKKGRVLLALEGFEKKTQKTPDHLLRLAEKRLTEWRLRG